MIVKSLLEIAYPPVCESCGEAYFKGEIPGICETCHDEHLLPLTAPFCEICGQSYPGMMPYGMRCSNCYDRYLNFDFATGAYRAEGDIMEWMHRFKYAGEIHFARMFGKLMSRLWEDQRLASPKNWIVVPVPLHKKRLRERGYNQSLEIAREWIKCAPPGQNLQIVEALKRIRNTTRQATLDRRDRLTNLKGAFVLSRQAEKYCQNADNILIVDDVLTTGTTASECASILRGAFSTDRISVITTLRG